VRFTACSLTSAITTEAIIGSINRGKGFLAHCEIERTKSSPLILLKQ